MLTRKVTLASLIIVISMASFILADGESKGDIEWLSYDTGLKKAKEDSKKKMNYQKKTKMYALIKLFRDMFRISIVSK